jgi:phenylalanyl-tRNA synthetase beta subunit
MLITSGDKPVALAGVMGGDGSQVAGDTRSLCSRSQRSIPPP